MRHSLAQVNVLGSSKELVMSVFDHFLVAAKHPDKEMTHSYNFMAQDPSTGLVTTTVDRYFEKKKNVHSQPPKCPRPMDQTIVEIHSRSDGHHRHHSI
jgi:hypothetical protein